MGSNPIVASMKAGAVVSFYAGMLIGLGALFLLPSVILFISPAYQLIQLIAVDKLPDNWLEYLGPLFIPSLLGIVLGFMLILIGDLCAVIVGIYRSAERTEQLMEQMLKR